MALSTASRTSANAGTSPLWHITQRPCWKGCELSTELTPCVARRMWATTVSDDNQNRFQRTEIAEFPLG